MRRKYLFTSHLPFPGGKAMRRKYLFASLLVAGGLSLPLLRNAWAQVEPPEPGAGIPVGISQPREPASRDPVPSPAEEQQSQSLSGCLALLKNIREERRHYEEEYKKAMAALDRREADLARTMRQLLEAERQEIATVEEELKKIAPTPAETNKAGGRNKAAVGTESFLFPLDDMPTRTSARRR
jgi:hypothetical protein